MTDVGRILVLILGYFVIGISLVPLIRNDNWIFRIFEYPRAQKLFLNVALVIAFIFVADWENWHDRIFAVLLGTNLLYLFYQVFPYTVLSRRQMMRSRNLEKGKHFRLMVCNVCQDNRQARLCLASIEENNPDIVILIETDAWWQSQLSPLEESYPHRVLKPLDNTYGMLLYSRLELVDPVVKYLVEDDIPSVHTKVKMPSGDVFFLYCLHPQPPVPNENPRSTERDAELLTIAREAKACTFPVVVAGDLNDVAWSYTTELFMKVSGLLDPRRGRGFFNTFHARYWYLRWPLDHIFCSDHFQLYHLRRLPAMGSDHFPILVELCLKEREKTRQENRKLQADGEEQQTADEKIAKVH